jgi:uncharacterized protein (DUF1778 family)
MWRMGQEDEMAQATARFEFRVSPEAKARIEDAAMMVHQAASDFARTAAIERAEEVLRQHTRVTVVPSSFFDELLTALDEPARPNQALARAATRASAQVRRP